ncbi:hypothetical protein [Streptomyces roseochromogenus]|uniref:Tyr recombinase domain-containing protein n=1 Tax=Streptomyces roseochromogenus subsp. oscitans DS 12.976 TaxID=1352936 RepID=V6JL13_STRRC|nr:hypothetical protein [Streptomyces roseochromogenus]EST20408.1 hypothetical protein M878_39635 [Streptomyces roseochromogenus subsp. oscitans DS 12.976]
MVMRRRVASHKSESVFPAPKGSKLNTTSFYEEVWRLWVDSHEAVPDRLGRPSRLPGMKAVAGIEGLVPHGLRHSMKVWLDELKHPRVAVEERIRHVIPGVEGTYSHTTPAMELGISADLQRLWEGSVAVKDHHREWEEARPGLPEKRREKSISQESPNLENQDQEDTEAA